LYVLVFIEHGGRRMHRDDLRLVGLKLIFLIVTRAAAVRGRASHHTGRPDGHPSARRL
jgi:hypothetical protein